MSGVEGICKRTNSNLLNLIHQGVTEQFSTTVSVPCQFCCGCSLCSVPAMSETAGPRGSTVAATSSLTHQTQSTELIIGHKLANVQYNSLVFVSGFVYTLSNGEFIAFSNLLLSFTSIVSCYNVCFSYSCAEGWQIFAVIKCFIVLNDEYQSRRSCGKLWKIKERATF